MIKNFLKKIIPPFVLNIYYFLWALSGAVFYRFPSKNLIVIGVTGTDGKSSVVEMIGTILKEAGYKVASTSSICFKIGDKEWKNTFKMTMPGRWYLQRFLRRAVKEKCQYAVLEVTSEGIKQCRHKFIDFDVAVITNLTPEHIESHGSFENYKKTKGELFRALANSKTKILDFKGQQTLKQKRIKKISVVNLDDSNSEYFLGFWAEEKYGFTTNNCYPKIKNCVRAVDIKPLPFGLSFGVEKERFQLNLWGSFNVYNALAAICVGLSQEIDMATIKKGLQKIKQVPGRMEVVIQEPFLVIVDFAHTPNALEKVYKAVVDYKTSKEDFKQIPDLSYRNSQLICVFGAAGGHRDKWKRPELGKIASYYCDRIILTNEDSYGDNLPDILLQIKSGISKDKVKVTQEILDRREAIVAALNMAQPGDIVLITGKGCEPYMSLPDGRMIPWDDRKVVRDVFFQLTTK